MKKVIITLLLPCCMLAACYNEGRLVVNPAPVVVNQPAVVTPPPVVVAPQPTTVWVEGRYVEQVQANGAVIRVWQPGHYEVR